jgi:hypothetical protein
MYDRISKIVAFGKSTDEFNMELTATNRARRIIYLSMEKFYWQYPVLYPSEEIYTDERESLSDRR